MILGLWTKAPAIMMLGETSSKRDPSWILTTAPDDAKRNMEFAVEIYLPKKRFRSCPQKLSLFPGCPFSF
jgi:hypothetical protein